MNSLIYFNSTTERWVLQSLRKVHKFLMMEADKPDIDLPLGTHRWVLGAERAMCGKGDGDVVEMTLSRCFPNKYTCDQGFCIPLR